jgi:uncharacterized membrane protein YhaH (DUF805 family)
MSMTTPGAPRSFTAPAMSEARSLRSRIRRTTFLYVVMNNLGVFNLVYVPLKFRVVGDAAATMRKVATSPMLYRSGILCGLISGILFLAVASLLHDLFRDVDQKQAMLLVVFVCGAVAIGLANLIPQFGVVIVSSNAEYLTVFSRPQLDAAGLALINLVSRGDLLAMAFWGAWLFPFGVLVMKSRFIPRLVGVLLMIAGAAYLSTSFLSILFPAQRQLTFSLAIPFMTCEMAAVLWLLIKGAVVPPAEQ